MATALSQVVGGAVPLFYFGRKNSSILRLGNSRFDGKAIFKACTNGSSEFMSNISMIFSAAFLGYSIGTAPIVGYHDGAKNHTELKGLFRKSLIMIGAFGIAMVVSAELLAVPLAKIFVNYDAELMKMSVSGFRIFALSFIFMGYAIYSSGFFTALNDGLTSALISFLRTLVFQTAAVIFLIAKRKKYHY